ncbi:MAG: YceI family protein [Verrucomicrobia bacterium]|nr:YceI family protein [Verrucomicrobiota bacterium]
MFLLDAPLESINGTGSGISGKFHFNHDNPAESKGRIVLATQSLIVPNSSMQEHMRGARWMNTAEYPEIVFEVEHLKDIQEIDRGFQATAVGAMTMRGVTHSMEVPVRITLLPGMLAARGGGVEGDLMVVRSNFTVRLTDFGINLSGVEDKVANETQITLSLAGASPKS